MGKLRRFHTRPVQRCNSVNLPGEVSRHNDNICFIGLTLLFSTLIQCFLVCAARSSFSKPRIFFSSIESSSSDSSYPKCQRSRNQRLLKMPPPAAKKTLLLSENPEEQEMMLRLINGDATVLFAPNRYTPLTANELELLCQRPVQLKEQSESSQGYASSYPESSVEPDFIPNDRVEHHEMSEEVDILNDTEEIEEYQEGSEGYNEEATRETHEVYSSDDNDDYCEASPPIDPSPTLVQWKSGGNFVTPIKDHNKWVQARQYSMQPQVAALAAQPVGE